MKLQLSDYDRYDPNEDLEYYDELDPALRLEFSQLPTPIVTAKDLAWYAAIHGTEQALNDLRDLVEECFPSFTPVRRRR